MSATTPNLPADLVEVAMTGRAALIAMNPDLEEEALIASTMDATFRVTRETLEKVVATLTRMLDDADGGTTTVVESDLVRLDGVSWGRVLLQREPEIMLVVYVIPGADSTAVLFYRTLTAGFDSRIPLIDAAAQATEGASESNASKRARTNQRMLDVVLLLLVAFAYWAYTRLRDHPQVDED